MRRVNDCTIVQTSVNSHSRWWSTSPSYRSSSRLWTTMCSCFKVLLIQETSAYQDTIHHTVRNIKRRCQIRKQQESLISFFKLSPFIFRDKIWSWCRRKRWQIQSTRPKIANISFSCPSSSTYEMCQAYWVIYSFTSACMKRFCWHLFQSECVFKSHPSPTPFLNGLPSPLIITFIKISLILQPLSLRHILFMLSAAHIHAGYVMYFLCSIYLQPTQGVLVMWWPRTGFDVTAHGESQSRQLSTCGSQD